jgi:hypothetical protein
VASVAVRPADALRPWVRRAVVWAYAPAVAVAFDHVVLGAAGGTGSAVVRELAARGLRVRAVTRGGTTDTPEGVEQVAADVGTAEGAGRACDGAAVVYHCAQPGYTQWPELFPPMTRAVIDGAAAAGAKLVFADNLYVYGPPDGAMTEETPQRARGKKGRTRIEMADAVLGASVHLLKSSARNSFSTKYGPVSIGISSRYACVNRSVAGSTSAHHTASTGTTRCRRGSTAARNASGSNPERQLSVIDATRFSRAGPDLTAAPLSGSSV